MAFTFKQDSTLRTLDGPACDTAAGSRKYVQ